MFQDGKRLNRHAAKQRHKMLCKKEWMRQWFSYFGPFCIAMERNDGIPAFTRYWHAEHDNSRKEAKQFDNRENRRRAHVACRKALRDEEYVVPCDDKKYAQRNYNWED